VGQLQFYRVYVEAKLFQKNIKMKKKKEMVQKVKVRRRRVPSNCGLLYNNPVLF
jgi:hypothetical protein